MRSWLSWFDLGLLHPDTFLLLISTIELLLYQLALILFKKSLLSVCLAQTPFKTLNLCFLDAKSIPEWKDGPVHQRQTLHLLWTTHDNSWHGQLLFSNGSAQRMSQSSSRSPPDQSVQRKLVSIITIWYTN